MRREVLATAWYLVVLLATSCSEWYPSTWTSPLSLRMHVDSQLIEQGDQVSFHLEIVNNESHPVAIFYLSDPATEYVWLRCIEPNGEEFVTGPFAYGPIKLMPSQSDWKSITIQPGKSYKVRGGTWTFDQVGTYRIEAELHYLNMIIRAKPVEVKVKAKQK